MSNLFPIQYSFTGGEIAPSLYGRMDIEKYSSSLTRLENFIISPHGGAKKRHGTRYIARTLSNKKTRLVAFSYNLYENYILEFGHKYIRVFKTPDQEYANQNNPTTSSLRQTAVNGGGQGSVYEIISPYTEDCLSGLSFTQSADVLYIVHPNHKPMELSRYSDVLWTLTEFKFKNGPFAIPKEEHKNITLNIIREGTDLYLESSEPLFKSSHVGTSFALTHYIDEAIFKSQGDSSGENWVPSYLMKEQTQSPTSSPLELVIPPSETDKFEVGRRVKFGTDETVVSTINGDKITFTPILVQFLTPGRKDCKVCIPTAQSGQEWGNPYTVYSSWNVASSGFWGGTVVLEYWKEQESRWVTYKTYTSTVYPNGTKTAGNAKNYADSGTVDEVTKFRLNALDFSPFIPEGNTDQDKGYFQFKALGTEYKTIVSATEFISNTKMKVAKESSMCTTDRPTTNWQEGAWSAAKGYPSSVGFYQERIVLGGSPTYPQTIWTSKTGDYHDFGVSFPIKDDDAVTAALVSRRVSTIHALVCLNKMIVLTSEGEWLISGSSTNDVITPFNLNASAQGYRGSADIEPLLIGDRILFVQSQGSRIRDLGYEMASDSYTGSDVTLLASHIFSGRKIKEWCYQQEPDSIIWIVTECGSLISLTYMKEHNIAAFARHPLGALAKAESIACVKTPMGDIVYLTIIRNGIKTIEEMRPQENASQEYAFYLDGGITRRSNVPFSEITELSHLEGLFVSIVADGHVCTPKSVRNGCVTLDFPCKTVNIGISYESILETLDLNLAAKDGTSMGRNNIRITGVTLRVSGTKGVFVGTSYGALTEHKDRTDENYSDPVRLQNGDLNYPLNSKYDAGRIIVSAPLPLPAFVMAIVFKADVADSRL